MAGLDQFIIPVKGLHLNLTSCFSGWWNGSGEAKYGCRIRQIWKMLTGQAHRSDGLEYIVFRLSGGLPRQMHGDIATTGGWAIGVSHQHATEESENDGCNLYHEESSEINVSGFDSRYHHGWYASQQDIWLWKRKGLNRAMMRVLLENPRT